MGGNDDLQATRMPMHDANISGTACRVKSNFEAKFGGKNFRTMQEGRGADISQVGMRQELPLTDRQLNERAGGPETEIETRGANTHQLRLSSTKAQLNMHQL